MPSELQPNRTNMAEVVAPPSTIVIGNEAKTKFLEWVASEPGIEVCPDVDMFHVFKEGYRGVVATKDIAAGVALVRIARSCCIGPETTDASKDAWCRAMASADEVNTTRSDMSAAPWLTRACFTVLRLLHERGLGKVSPFHAYLSILPCDHRLPMEWSDAELKLLQGTSVEPLVCMGSLESQFEAFQQIVALHPSMWDPSVCTKTAFAKGVNWVRSRGFTVVGDPHMIPGADMFNHDPNRQSVQIETDGDDFVMETVHPVKAGEEVFSSFGHLSNAQLLNSYGFVLPGNSFDTVLIPTKLVVDTCYVSFMKLEGDKLGEEESKAVWDRRLAMVASNSGEGEQEAFVISKYDLLPESLADMVQILMMGTGEEVAYATIAAVAQAKMEKYSSLVDSSGDAGEGDKGAQEPEKAMGVDARMLAEMLIREEKNVLSDLRMQLMSEILNDDEEDIYSDNDDNVATGSDERAKKPKTKK